MQLFLVSFLYALAAEMGDKTQVVAMTFAARYSLSMVLAAVGTAILAIQLVSVGFGHVVRLLFPLFWIHLGSALAFLAFGLWSLRPEKEEAEKETSIKKPLSPFILVAATFFLAEFGDKTMLATATVASRSASWIPVWLGGSAGMMVADGAAIALGKMLGDRLPKRSIKYVTAFIFFVSAFFAFGEAMRYE